MSEEKKGLLVHAPSSPAGMQLLDKAGVSLAQLNLAINRYEVFEGVDVGTRIGVCVDGFIGHESRNWAGDPRGPFIAVPWWQIHELLNETIR